MGHYIIVEEIGINKLEKQVNARIAHGYSPVGGVLLEKIGTSRYYVQAMIKKE